jgi:methionine synthase I (cobalamin-dependent)
MNSPLGTPVHPFLLSRYELSKIGVIHRSGARHRPGIVEYALLYCLMVIFDKERERTMTTLQALLDSGRTIVADGGMGSLLVAMGMQGGDAPELWNVEYPDLIRKIHADYIQAGSQIVLTNSFGGSLARLTHSNLGERTVELNQAAAQLARLEADAAPHPVVVGGSMGPSGDLLQPLGKLSYDDAKASFAEQAEGLIAGGVDVLWIETMSDLNEVKAAVEGIRSVNADFPIVATMTFDTKGRTIMGVKPEKAVQTLGDLGVIALGGNCGNGPDEIEDVMVKMREQNADAVLIAKANAGLPEVVDGKAVYNATPAEMADYALRVQAQGARIIGACCGSTAAHIKAIAEAVNG